MEYVQESVTTLHDFGEVSPTAPLSETAVVVALTDRDRTSRAAERTFEVLASLDPARVVVALRATPREVPKTRRWLSGFDTEIEVLWCNGPRLEALLAEGGLDGPLGKGRDVWLATGIAATERFVAVQDADAKGYRPARLRRLCAPLADGFAEGARASQAGESDYEFVKGYYARVENGRLYGRLCRLLYEPLVRSLAKVCNAPVLRYLGGFRYALAGEFAATSSLVRRMRFQRGWGLEVGTLGEAFELVGAAASAQVDLGRHRHEHRSVSDSGGLAAMSTGVSAALFTAIEDAGLEPEYEDLPARYRERADSLIEQYAADAVFNGLEYDRADERRQVRRYADSIAPPGEDDRLPAWSETRLDPEAVRSAAHADAAALE